MNSPISHNVKLVRIEIEPDLITYRCPDTQGIYIPAQSYWHWISKQPERLPHLPAPEATELPREEPNSAKICPESGLLMLRYKVGHGFTFSIERSPTGGIWLDAGEWEALKERNFHDELHLVFTQPWQNAVRNADLIKTEHTRLENTFGPELFASLTNLKTQLEDSPHQAQAIAYLRQ